MNNNFKNIFPIFDNYKKTYCADLVYLDNAATTQKPDFIIEKLSDFYTHMNSNIHRGIYKLSYLASEAYDETRDIIAIYLTDITGESWEIIFTKNTTESLNLLATSLEINGDILLTKLEHHSNILPWIERAKRDSSKKIQNKFLDLHVNGTLDYNSLDNIDIQSLAVASISWSSNVSGEIIDIERISKKIKEINPEVFVSVDAAQIASKLLLEPEYFHDIDFQNIDSLSFSSHKMFGPTGVGILAIKRDKFEQLKNKFQVGGGTIESVKFIDDQVKIQYKSTVESFEAGTPQIAEIITFGELFKRREYMRSLIDLKKYNEAIRYLENILFTDDKEELRFIGRSKDMTRKYSPVYSFTIPNIHPHDLADMLDSDNICVRSGQHCTGILHQVTGINATTRISLSYYNTIEDIEKLEKSLLRVIQQRQ